MFWLQPMSTMFQIWEDKSVGYLPLMPYTTMLTNAFLWFIYGFMLQEPSIWTGSAVGFFAGCFYFLEFCRFAPKRSHTLPGSVVQHFHFCFAVLGATLVLAVAPFPFEGVTIIGQAAVFFCVAMFASPLAALPTVLETQSAKAIPLNYTIAVLLNSALWTIVGLFEMQDKNIYIPSMLGLVLSIVQVGLKIVYGNGPGRPATPIEGGEASRSFGYASAMGRLIDL